MAYIIEVDEDETLVLIFPDDSILKSKSLSTIFEAIREHYTNEIMKDDKPDNPGSLGKLFTL